MNNGNPKENKKEVKVINIPKRKRPLATPSYIIRICLIICFVLCILLLSSPFLRAKLYITDDLEITTAASEAYNGSPSQEELDNAEKELQAAFDSLEKIEKKKSDSSELPVSETNVMALDSANFEWSYTVSRNVDPKPLAELIDKVRTLDKRPYTSESVKKLNNALLKGQKLLRADVVVSQSVLQMLLGGAIGESLGNVKSLGNTISHSIFAMILAGIPFVCFIVLCFDKRSHLKHIVCMVGAIICLAIIFAVLYPFVGRGAVLTILLYIMIFILNLTSIYAKQQEDYIIKNPDKEPEFTEKHPHFVKALINYKAFVKYAAEPNIKPKKKKKK